MTLPGIVIILGTSLVAAWAATGAAIPVLRRTGVMDRPNERSSHVIPTPRGGGIGILLGIVGGVLAAQLLGIELPRVEILIGALLIALVGFLDDRLGGVSAAVRLAVQFAAAILVIWRSGGLTYSPLPAPLGGPLGILAVPVALVWIVGVTNLYNFLDGIDGFAGFQGVVAGLGLATLAGGGPLMVVGLALAGACGGFLVHNWSPARVFMGDVGSGTLGFILAASPFELAGTQRAEALFAVALCLWFFLADGTFTLAVRLWRRERVWDAHRTHLYQRLVSTGLGHSTVVLATGVAATLLAAVGVMSTRAGQPGARWAVVVLALGAFLAYREWTRLMEKGVRPPSLPVPGR